MVKLKVAEAIQDDVNRGIVRIDSNVMRELGIRTGEVVEIVGERKTVAVAERSYPGDIGLNIIRMDGLIRRNAKTSISEYVEVNIAKIKEATKIILAPARKDIMIKADPTFFKRNLLGRAVIKGDIISIGSRQKRRPARGNLFDEFVDLLDEGFFSFGFSDLKFIVVDTNPKEAVIITHKTHVEYKPESITLKEEESVPEITYEDIGGLKNEISIVREIIELPIKHPEIFDRLGIEPPKGVLLHGPPGTGKTLLARAVAAETKSNFILINGPEIMSKFYGQSEENLRKKFEDAQKNTPSIIFIDEIDAIASKREEVHGEVEKRVVAQLLALMDGLKSRGKVIVIAATNIPNALDPALRRPGRFDREIEIGVPNEEERLEVLKVHTRNMPLSPPFNPVIVEDSINNYETKLSNDIKSLEKDLRSLNKELEEKNKVVENSSGVMSYSEKKAVEQIKDLEAKIMTKNNDLSKLKDKSKSLSNTYHKTYGLQGG